jgi:hypothetical protein
MTRQPAVFRPTEPIKTVYVEHLDMSLRYTGELLTGFRLWSADCKVSRPAHGDEIALILQAKECE